VISGLPQDKGTDSSEENREDDTESKDRGSIVISQEKGTRGENIS
jgi:hypothetical protein